MLDPLLTLDLKCPSALPANTYIVPRQARIIDLDQQLNEGAGTGRLQSGHRKLAWNAGRRGSAYLTLDQQFSAVGKWVAPVDRVACRCHRCRSPSA